jgi:hypothetical protein
MIAPFVSDCVVVKDDYYDTYHIDATTKCGETITVGEEDSKGAIGIEFPDEKSDMITWSEKCDIRKDNRESKRMIVPTQRKVDEKIEESKKTRAAIREKIAENDKTVSEFRKKLAYLEDCGVKESPRKTYDGFTEHKHNGVIFQHMIREGCITTRIKFAGYPYTIDDYIKIVTLEYDDE